MSGYRADDEPTRIPRKFTVTCYWGPGRETTSLFGTHFGVCRLRAHSPRAAAHAAVIEHCLRSVAHVPSGFDYDPARASGAFLAVSRKGRTHGYVFERDDGLRLLSIEETRAAAGAWETFERFEELRSVAG